MSLIDQFVLPRMRDCWKRIALRRVHYADRADRLDLLYRVEDPWQMTSPQEQARFAWTNRLIATQFGRPETILEIGCGEGHQSQYLARACGRLRGVDVSRRAVERARQRCPEGDFTVGDPFSVRLPGAVDLVVACEVVYYAKDVPGFLAQLSRLGRACLVTYYHGQAPALAPHFASLPGCAQEQFRVGDVEWTAIWWSTTNQ